MEKTTIALPMGKADVRQAVTAVIEHLALHPISAEERSQEELAAYGMGLSVLFGCLRSTF